MGKFQGLSGKPFGFIDPVGFDKGPPVMEQAQQRKHVRAPLPFDLLSVLQYLEAFDDSARQSMSQAQAPRHPDVKIAVAVIAVGLARMLVRLDSGGEVSGTILKTAETEVYVDV